MTLRSKPATLRAWKDRSAAKARQRQRARETGGEPAKPRKSLPKVNKARAEKKRAEHFGTPDRVAAIRRMACACSRAPKRHPECTGGFSDPSHTTSRGAGGGASDIIPKSSGCHHAWHQHGKLAWLAAVGWTEQDLEAELERTNAELAKPDPMPE